MNWKEIVARVVIVPFIMGAVFTAITELNEGSFVGAIFCPVPFLVSGTVIYRIMRGFLTGNWGGTYTGPSSTFSSSPRPFAPMASHDGASMHSDWRSTSTSSASTYSSSPQSYSSSINTDGTPMCGGIDIRGNTYGSTSSQWDYGSSSSSSSSSWSSYDH